MPGSLHVGIKVAAGTVHICTSAGEAWESPNDAAGIRSVGLRLKGRRIVSIAILASEGDAAPLAAELTARYLPVSIISPSELSEFSRSKRRFGDAASGDTVMLVKMAQSIRPAVFEHGPLIQTY